MSDEPDPDSRAPSAPQRVLQKADEFRMHAELAAIFEGPRKFEARILPTLDADFARSLQLAMAKLDKSRPDESGVLTGDQRVKAAALLTSDALSTNDYHIYRRPGETMIVRWIAGDEVETFYQRLQAHFDAALGAFRADERSSLEWKQDADTKTYLDLLDKLEVPMAQRFRRDAIREHGLVVLSTQTADEMNIAYITDHIMGATAAEVVGPASAPPDEPSEDDLAWFFKLFMLRGFIDGLERMCFFTFLQKTTDDFDF